MAQRLRIQGRMGQRLKQVLRIHQQLEDKEQSMARSGWWTGDGRERAVAGDTLEFGANQGSGNRMAGGACPWLDRLIG